MSGLTTLLLTICLVMVFAVIVAAAAGKLARLDGATYRSVPTRGCRVRRSSHPRRRYHRCAGRGDGLTSPLGSRRSGRGTCPCRFFVRLQVGRVCRLTSGQHQQPGNPCNRHCRSAASARSWIMKWSCTSSIDSAHSPSASSTEAATIRASATSSGSYVKSGHGRTG